MHTSPTQHCLALAQRRGRFLAVTPEGPLVSAIWCGCLYYTLPLHVKRNPYIVNFQLVMTLAKLEDGPSHSCITVIGAITASICNWQETSDLTAQQMTAPEPVREISSSHNPTPVLPPRIPCHCNNSKR